jgi:hypothetical protein
VEGAGEEDRRTESDLRDGVRQGDLAEQCPASLGLAGLRCGGGVARDVVDLPAPYSSWAHAKGVPAKVVAQIMGHTKVDTTINVYTQVLDGAVRAAADRVGSELFRVVQIPDGTTTPTH